MSHIIEKKIERSLTNFALPKYAEVFDSALNVHEE